ncbi:hypothetical protein CEXT_696091 [Caerostris extrusa]|uniref:Uncharacterized protein n=1 Tax=Caerostris extrusa TaxID=172846 RepID=A0AAV4VLR7_CAEEX|nr:hypothetical protein CEXT_696091 [Caerostris extrusa]
MMRQAAKRYRLDAIDCIDRYLDLRRAYIYERPDPEQGSVLGGCRATAPRIPGCSHLQPVAHQSSLLMEEYLNDLWVTARLVIKCDRHKVVTKYDIKSALYNRADIIL